jgi:hypothetical protein
MLNRFRNIAYVMACAVATIPLWHYITDGRILALMVAAVTFAYINVVLSTVHAAQPILSSEKAKSPLPRWLPDKPKYQKWWLLIRQTMGWYIFLIPPKIGLALGLVEYLLTTQSAYGWNEFLRPYFYWTSSHPLLYPQWETLLLGSGIITVFSFLNQGLLCSIIISAKAQTSKVIAIIVIVTLFTVGIANTTISIAWNLHPCSHSGARCEGIPQSYRRIKETIYSTTNTFIGKGVLLSANIMRPAAYNRVWNESNGWETYRWDNRPFVARQIVAGLLGMLLYAGATWAVLWFVEDEKS